MNQLVRLNFTLFLLYCTFSKSFETIPSQDPSFLSTLSPSIFISNSGQIQLLRDISGFYVNAVLTDDLSLTNDSYYFQTTVPMILNLFTSQTLLIDNCSNFLPYNCSQYSCKPYKNEKVSIDSPYISGEGYYAKAAVHLDYMYWSLKDNVSIASSCTANSVLPYGLTRYGTVGMGVAGNSFGNYLTSPIFSISLSQDLFSGQILFGSNISEINSSSLLASLKADENWHIKGHDSHIRVGNSSHKISSQLIFDINADTIGLPVSIYYQVIKDLSELAPMECCTRMYQPACFYKGDIRNLPDIVISVQNQTIRIDPDTYVQNEGNLENLPDEYITLNLKAIGHNLADESYVTPKYDDYIILDSHVMRKYYIVFDGRVTPIISLYGSKISSNIGMMIEVIFGAIVFVAIVFCCCFCSFKKKETPQIYTDLRPVDILSSSKEPLIPDNQSTKCQCTEESLTDSIICLQGPFPDSEHKDIGNGSLNGVDSTRSC